MSSALARSLQFMQGNLNEQQMVIDPKAVGAHRPLSRRRTSAVQNQPGSPGDSDESSSSGNSLFGGGDSLTSLSSLMQQLARHQQQQQQQQNAPGLSGRGHRKLDRSHSEPVQQQPQVQPSQNNSSRYKTELCRPFEENGTCKYGDKCQFAHGFHELRSLVRHPKYKTELCRTFHTIGFCPYGPRCHFIHNADEARNSSGGSSGSSPPPPTPNHPISSSKKGRTTMFSLAQLAQQQHGGSTADSPSPPSSLSESPTSVSHNFFGSSDDFLFPGNPFSPASHHQPTGSFHFGASTLFPTKRMGSKGTAELDSPSPVGSLSSDLDSLSLAGTSPSPPLMAAMDLSRQLRLPIFSRISETLNED